MGPVGGAYDTDVGGRRSGPGGARGKTSHGVSGRARGQSLVEFALVVPLFLFLIFAVVEYSLINSSIGAYNFAAKDAARYGAIVGPGDTGACNCQADLDMLNIINSHTIGVVAAVPVEVDFFEASESGAYPGSGVGKQDVYLYTGGAWTRSGTLGWPVGTRDDRLVSQDYLGVHIIYRYTYVTAFFSSLGATITLTADSVQRIEPQQLFHHPAPGATQALAALSPSAPVSPLGAALGLLAIAPACLYKPSRADKEARRARGLFGPFAKRDTRDRKERRS